MTDPTKVLIIDDAAFILKVTEALLSAEGFGVKTAESGSAGLEIWKDWKPDVVLLDLMMPDKDGWQILEESRQDAACEKAKVIIYSAKDDAQARERATTEGAFAFLLKPVEKKLLSETIRNAVAEDTTAA